MEGIAEDDRFLGLDLWGGWCKWTMQESGEEERKKNLRLSY
jgi:hypothetical protein